MPSRVALVGFVVEQSEAAEPLNTLLHQYKDYIVGRMGIPYRERGIHLISIVIDAPADVISALTGKAGMITGITAKALYSKLPEVMNERADQ